MAALSCSWDGDGSPSQEGEEVGRRLAQGPGVAQVAEVGGGAVESFGVVAGSDGLRPHAVQRRGAGRTVGEEVSHDLAVLLAAGGAQVEPAQDVVGGVVHGGEGMGTGGRVCSESAEQASPMRRP